jgi:hypothetical protein
MLVYRNNCGASTPLQILAALSQSIHNSYYTFKDRKKETWCLNSRLSFLSDGI